MNNAGVLRYSTFTGAPDLDAARQEMEVNYFGTLRMCRAFAPVLAAAGGGAIVNMLSVTSFFTNPFDASYGASKAAEWSLTNGVRVELHHQGTLVVAVHAGFIDTDMAALTDAPKISPESVAGQVFERGRGRPDRGAGRRAVPVRQGLAVPRPRAHLPAHPGILGRRGLRHQLTRAIRAKQPRPSSPGQAAQEKHRAGRFPGSAREAASCFTVARGRGNQAQRR